jgi:hypothetical protein
MIDNTPTRLRIALDLMSPEQRKALRLPHQGTREIARRIRQERRLYEKYVKQMARPVSTPPPYDSPEGSEFIREAAAVLDANPVPVPHMIRGAVNYG